jgi:hypothetical protein
MKVKSLLPNRWVHEKLEYPEGTFREYNEVFDMHPMDFQTYYHHVVEAISRDGISVKRTTKPKDYHLGNDENTDPNRAKDELEEDHGIDVDHPHYHEHTHEEGHTHGHIHEFEDPNHKH